MARGLKFCIGEAEGLYYPCSENKGAAQLRGYRETNLHLCFCICKKPTFSYNVLANLIFHLGLPKLTRTEEGLEEQFAANYLGPFLLTNLLLGMCSLGYVKKSNCCRFLHIYTPGIYADGYIVFAFPFVHSSVRMFVRSFVLPSRSWNLRQSFALKFLKLCISQQLLIRKHSYLDHSYPGGLAFTP